MKNQLLEKAIDLFIEKGYENVSIDMICSECNVTKGSFYHHFATKDSLLIDYYDMMNEKNFIHVLEEVAISSDYLEKLWIICSFYIKGNLSMPPQLNKQLIIANVNNGGKLFTASIEYCEKYYPDTMRLIQKLTEKGQEVHQIKTDFNWRTMFELYCSGIHGLLIEWSATDGSYDLLEHVRKFFDIIYAPGYSDIH